MTLERDEYEHGFTTCDLCRCRRRGLELEPAQLEVADVRQHGVRVIRIIRCRDAKWCKAQQDKREREAHLGGARP